MASQSHWSWFTSWPRKVIAAFWGVAIAIDPFNHVLYQFHPLNGHDTVDGSEIRQTS